jgi:phospholipase/carboxylesterase
MNDHNQSKLNQIDDWVFRIKMPSSPHAEARILLLLHGHLGNEDVMWILTKPLPSGYILLSPRAPINLGENQYSWHNIQSQWPDINFYQKLTDQLVRRVDTWAKSHAPGVEGYDVMGFSQGAVLAYALAILHPNKVNRIAAIAGFIPQHWKSALKSNALNNKNFFIAHGTEDEIVPVQKAQQASEWLSEAGANIKLCTADTGHKISANCFNGLGEFFKR